MKRYTKSYPIVADSIDTEYRLSAYGVILFLQDAIASDMATWHAAAFDIAPENLIWVVLEYNIVFDNSVPYWSDMVEVSISVTELTQMRVYFDFEMVAGNGSQFAHGTSVWTMLESGTRLPYTQMRDFVLRKSGLDQAEMSVRHPRNKNKDKGEQYSFNNYKTQMSDVDFNGHICNRTYLPIALGCFSDEFVKSHSICALNIKYLKETYLGNTIECTCYLGDGHYFCEMHSDSGEEVCQVSFSWTDICDKKDVRTIVLRK